ncbi:MAG: ROK family protein [Pseudothermotoga lettingae]|nr:MAG: ROK family protein [Pseudothermotoga lettingae]
MKTVYSFACDIGGTNLRIAIVDSDGKIYLKRKFSTPKKQDKLFENISQEFEKMNEKFEISHCIFSIAGAVFEDGSVLIPNVFPQRIKLKEAIRSFIPNVQIYIIDDRTAGLIGEICSGCARGFKEVAYLIIGTGVGLGIFSQGQIIFGNQGIAGSAGWIHIKDPLTEEYRDIESLISGPAIAKMFSRICGKEIESSESVLRLYLQKNTCATEVVKNVSFAIGYLLSTITNILNPEIIVLSGSVGLNWKVFEEEAVKTLKKFTSPFITLPIIKVSSLGEDAQLVGCSKYTSLRKE